MSDNSKDEPQKPAEPNPIGVPPDPDADAMAPATPAAAVVPGAPGVTANANAPAATQAIGGEQPTTSRPQDLPYQAHAVATRPDESVGPDGRKRWHVGTLTYTGGALVLLFVWLLWGDFALSMRDRSVGPLTEKFLLAQGASNTLKQLLTSTLPTLIALILSPIVSYKSDRLRSRWGRRIPYLLVPTPIAGLAMIGIAFSPQLGAALYTAAGHAPAAGQTLQQAASGYTLGVFTVLWTVFEVAVIISGAVLGGLINDVVPRSVLGRFFGLFRAVSLLDGIIFNALLLQHAKEHFTLMFALIGILFGGGFTLMCFGVREGNYPEPPPEEAGTGAARTGIAAFAARFVAASMSYLRECFAQPYYLLCFAMFTLGALTFRPINDFTIRFAEQLNMRDADYGNLVAVSYVVSLVMAFPLGLLVDRFHAIRMALISVSLYMLTTLYGSWFIHDPTTFGIALVAHTVLSGTYFTCTASLGQALLPRAKFSQYASAGGIVTSLSLLALGPSIGALLDLTGNNYRLTFWAGLILATMTLVVTLLVYVRFLRYGGPRGYVAPGDTGIARGTEPPRHLPEVLSLYFLGAGVGVALGYVLAYHLVPRVPGGAPIAVGLGEFHHEIWRNARVFTTTMLTVIVCVIPGALLGALAGTRVAKRADDRRAPA